MDAKEQAKAILSLLQELKAVPARHPLRMHFLNLYLSALDNTAAFFSSLLDALKAGPQGNTPELQRSLARIAEILKSQLLALQKLESQGYFHSFGMNSGCKDSLSFLFKSSNEVIDLIEKGNKREHEHQSVSLLRLEDKELETSMVFLDEEVQKSRFIREKTQLDFNMSLRQIQNDLASVFFVKQLEASGNYRKRLIKRLDFITGFQKFVREFEPGSEISSEQLWIIEKKLGMKESLSASKIDEFFSEIWGNVNERVKISGYKRAGEEFNRGLTEFFARKTSGASNNRHEKAAESQREIEDLTVEEEKHEDPQPAARKEGKPRFDRKSCGIY